MKTHRDVIALWPDRAEFARAIGVSSVAARAMYKRNRIPNRRWMDVLQAAEKYGFTDLSYPMFTKLTRGPLACE